MEIETKILICFFALGVAGFFGMVYMHEMVHKEIFESYGIESKIDLFKEFPFYALTIPEKNCPNDTCTLAHDINESIGYHLFAFYFLLFAYFSFSLLIKLCPLNHEIS